MSKKINISFEKTNNFIEIAKQYAQEKSTIEYLTKSLAYYEKRNYQKIIAEMIESALSNNLITKTEFKTVRDFINRLYEYLEDVHYKMIVSKKDEIPEQSLKNLYEIHYVGSGFRGIKKKLSLLDSFNDENHNILKNVYLEYQNLYLITEELKPLIGKKPSKKEIEKKEKDEVAKPAQKEISAFSSFLDEFMKKIYSEIYEFNKQFYIQEVNSVMEEYNAGAFKTFREFKKLAHISDFAKQESAVFFAYIGQTMILKHPVCEKVMADYSSKYAKNSTEYIIESYKNRIIEKLTLVFAKNKNCKYEIKRYTIQRGLLEVLMDIELDEKSGFLLETTIEYGLSSRGKFFTRYPSRFKNVVINGEQIKSPSFEKVISILTK